MIGGLNTNQTILDELAAEQSEWGDLAVLPYTSDTYDMLTRKLLASIVHLHGEFPHMRHLLKVGRRLCSHVCVSRVTADLCP